MQNIPMVNAVTVKESDPLVRALQSLSDHDVVLVVNDAGKYVGEITARQLTTFSGDARTTKSGTLARKGASLEEKDADVDYVGMFATGGLESVAILDKNRKVKGLVGKASVLSQLVESGKLSGKVSDVMAPPYTIESGQSASQASHLITRTGIPQIVVTEGKKAVGTVSALDLAQSVAPYRHQAMNVRKVTEKVDVEQTPVSTIMREIAPDGFVEGKTALQQAAKRMLESHNTHALLVTENGKLKGLLGFGEILRGLPQEKDVQVEIIGLTEEGKFAKASIEEAARHALKKMGPQARLQLRIKSSYKGKSRKEYEVSARLDLDGKQYFAATPGNAKRKENWDLYLSIKEVLGALQKEWQHRTRR